MAQSSPIPPRPTTLIILATGRPPTSSYWAGATREQLAAAIAARKHQQAIPSDRDTRYDPMIAATLDLSRRMALAKARADLRRRVR